MLQLAWFLLINALPTVPLYESGSIFRGEPKQNHSPSVIETPDGDLLACWHHGDRHRGRDTLLIRGARKKRGSNAWSAPFLMADNKNFPDENCVLFVDPRGTL